MMKKFLSVILAILMISTYVPLTVGAASTKASGTCGENLTWVLDNDGTLTISGTGEMYDYDRYSSMYTYTTSINNVVMNDGITSIGDYAFYHWSNVDNVTIPNSVETIGDYAFYSCGGVENLIIGTNVKSIGEYAFTNCYIEKLTIPDSVTSIGSRAFSSGTIKSVKIGSGITEIPDFAFYYCDSLGLVTIDKGVKTIGESSFAKCKHIADVVIPDGVTTIKNAAFMECRDLKSVTIPSSVELIDVNAFAACQSIEDVYYSGSETEWNSITINSNNENLTSATIHFNYVAPDMNLSVGDIVEFGSYPQTQVVDQELIVDLLDYWSEYIGFSTSYPNYAESKGFRPTSYCHYMDVEYNGEKYRLIRFSKYRPYYADYEALDETDTSSNQYMNGYRVNTWYCFKFEPIKWIVLDPKEGLLLSQSILDVQPFSATQYYNTSDRGFYNDENYTNFQNDWQSSSLRRFLSSKYSFFCDDAFSENEKENLVPIPFEYSTNNKTISGTDYATLLTTDEARKAPYGFHYDYDFYDPARKTSYASDYSKCVGLDFNKNFDAYIWYLRTPGYNTSYVYGVTSSGDIFDSFRCESSEYGVRPVVKLSELPDKVEENICEHANTTLTGKVDATCTVGGYTGDEVCDKCGITTETGTTIAALDHEFGNWAETKAPTCTEKGEEKRDCSRCDYFETKEVPAKGHEDKDDDGFCDNDDCKENICEHENTTLTGKKEATCTENGYTGDKVCDKCGITTETGTTIAALNHNMGTWTVTTEATCENAGEERRDCTLCDYFEVREIPAKDHEDKDDDGFCDDDDCKDNICAHENTTLTGKVDATCTENGYTGDKVCDKCGVTTVTGTAISALNHEMSAWEETKAPTCTEKGEERSDCSRCDYFEVREIAAKDHEDKDDDGFCDDEDCQDNICAHENTTLTGKKEATCTEGGYTGDKVCDKCKETIEKGSELTSLGHTEVVDSAVAATCTETGLTEGKHCSVCGEVLVAQTVVKENGHTEVIDKAVEPTCTQTGLTEGKHCSVCGEVLVAQTVVKENGHNYKSVVTDPTCTADGYTTYTCTACVDTYVADYTGATGHSWSEWVETKAPTVTEEGEKSRTCGECGVTETDVIPTIEEDPTPDTDDDTSNPDINLPDIDIPDINIPGFDGDNSECDGDVCERCGLVHTNIFQKLICKLMDLLHRMVAILTGGAV